MLQVIVFLLIFPQSSLCVANLNYFETLSHIHVTSRIKRSSDGVRDLIKNVKFRAFSRNFDLTLKSGTNLMTKDFRARIIDGDGSSSFFEIDQSRIFSGYLTDKPDVTVHAHIEETLWSIQIFEKDIYAVEPAWRLLSQKENPKNDTMVAYRASDFTSDVFNGNLFTNVPYNFLSSRFCGMKNHGKIRDLHPDDSSIHNYTSRQKESDSVRQKRSHNDVVCVMFIVGDYSFYKRKCRSNHIVCSALMFSYVTTADMIYRKSVFEDSKFDKYTGVGLQIGEIALYSTYTSKMLGFRFDHFNENRDWTIYEKLDAFAYYVSYLTQHKHFCLNHVFTDYPFPQRILGLAWTNTICYLFGRTTPGEFRNNSGVSSGIDIIAGPISTIQMNLVFAHEVGKLFFYLLDSKWHNFGSNHDPETEECSKPDIEGGHFLMWNRAVSGSLPNHYKFSPCSLKNIGRQLEINDCFFARSSITSFCGNGVIDRGEECDAGSFGIVDTDLCCTSNCTLRPKAKCSEVNQACCKNCTMSPAGTLCYSGDWEECRLESYCTGDSFDCPDPELEKDWKPCRDQGQCYRGICRNFCEIKSIREGVGLKGCLCRSDENGEACKWCCFDVTKPNEPGPCKAYSNNSVADGRVCYKGYCKAGVCRESSMSAVRRFYRYLPEMKGSHLVHYLKTNIVMCVIVLSLMLWLPPVYFIHQADVHEMEERRKKKAAISCQSITPTASYNTEYQIPKKKMDQEDIAVIQTASSHIIGGSSSPHGGEELKGLNETSKRRSSPSVSHDSVHSNVIHSSVIDGSASHGSASHGSASRDDATLISVLNGNATHGSASSHSTTSGNSTEV